MSQQPIDLSDDLRRLRDEGYEVEVREGHLLVHHVPYVGRSKTVAFGTLVSTLSLAGDRTTRPDSHIAFFAGEYPCHRDGSQIEQLRHQSGQQQLAAQVVVDHSFSNKPPDGYVDYHHKMTTYINVISSPAMAIDATATPRTFASVVPAATESSLVYLDTSSSRYGISTITEKLKGLKVAIVGVGGTGSYVLDLVAKTPVAEIHLYDGDQLVSHNAFRSPGAASLDDLRASPHKAEYFANSYGRMHRGIVAHPQFISASNVDELARFDFVFVCVDVGEIKRVIFERLRAANVTFVDVGMGVEIVDDSLMGILRTTTVTPKAYEHVSKRVPFHDGGNDVYRTAVQVADLNMLNAALAVIKWKKLYGFYQDLEHEHNTTYSTNMNAVINDDYQT